MDGDYQEVYNLRSFLRLSYKNPSMLKQIQGFEEFEDESGRCYQSKDFKVFLWTHLIFKMLAMKTRHSYTIFLPHTVFAILPSKILLSSPASWRRRHRRKARIKTLGRRKKWVHATRFAASLRRRRKAWREKNLKLTEEEEELLLQNVLHVFCLFCFFWPFFRAFWGLPSIYLGRSKKRSNWSTRGGFQESPRC